MPGRRRGRVEHASANERTDHRNGDSRDECGAPTPGGKRLRTHDVRQQRADRRSEHRAHRRAEDGEARKETAPLGRSVLAEEYDRARELPADGHTLTHPQHDDQQGGRHPYGLVGRQEAHEHGGNRHHGDRQQQRAGTAVTVPDVPEQHGAHRPHQETHGESTECRQQGNARVVPGEEPCRQDRREKTVNREIVPLEHVADDAGAHDPSQRPRRGLHRPTGRLGGCVHGRSLTALTADRLRC